VSETRSADGRRARAAGTVDLVQVNPVQMNPVQMIDAPTAAAPAKPVLRGWSHVVAFGAVAVLSVIMVAVAEASAGERWILLIYVAGTLAMFGVSALYHRVRWQPRAHAVMKRLDHSTIFLAIAGAYTPVAAFGLEGWQRPAVLVTVWVGAAVGVTLEWLPYEVPRPLFTAVYVIVGWSASVALPQLYSGLGAVGFGLVLGGGVAYTVGAVVYALKRPDPWPRVFGFHEVFHLFTIVGAGCHLAAMAFVVVPAL
jgi:hemolysin III